MKHKPAALILTVVSSTFSGLVAQAHEGHGLPGSNHWHSTDVWGFVALGIALAAAIWFGRRK